LKKKNLRAKKHLGQNFLYDPAIAGRIAAGSGAGEGDLVVELGPGRGILTDALVATGARVLAIELDPPLVEELRARYAEQPRVEILHADLTTVQLTPLLEERGARSCRLAGNIPYYLTRDVLFDFLVDHEAVIDGAVIMVQREVGERIVSEPGSRVYGITSVVLQSLYEVRSVMKVSPGSFTPRPRVASVVLGFTPRTSRHFREGELNAFRELVKNLFGQRRKTIQNTLKSAYGTDAEQLEEIQERTGVDLGSRPEQLSYEQFLDITRALAHNDQK
jgi:16S rRNA (adenine1518-N6/adenine1519-N6)-dimethyltransferase